MPVRAYTPADLGACLDLFGGNCPPFFDPSERAGYRQFLEDPQLRGEYFVLLRGDEVVACGGVWVNAEGEAGLTWGMVRADLHRQGLGTRLTTFRLAHLRARPDVRLIRLETSQHTVAFYARHGFEVTERRPDGFAPGLDEIRMVLRLPPS